MEVTRGQHGTSIIISTFPRGARGQRVRSHPRSTGEPYRRRWRWWTRVWVAFAGWSIATALRLIYRTLRICYIDPADMFGRHARGERMIVAFWHDAIALMPLVPARLGWPGRVNVMLSWHRDAEIAARAMARFGVAAVRGSSTRGWLGGLRGLLEARARGEDIAIVPDGPRGPRHQAKDGVVQLARSTGLPVFAFGVAARRARRLSSWDRMQIPWPFARVAIVVSEPLALPRSESGLADARAAIEAALAEVNATAAAAVGVPAE